MLHKINKNVYRIANKHNIVYFTKTYMPKTLKIAYKHIMYSSHTTCTHTHAYTNTSINTHAHMGTQKK